MARPRRIQRREWLLRPGRMDFYKQVCALDPGHNPQPMIHTYTLETLYLHHQWSFGPDIL